MKRFIEVLIIIGLLFFLCPNTAAGQRKSQPAPRRAGQARQAAAPRPAEPQELYRFRQKSNSESKASDAAVQPGIVLIEGEIKGLIVQKGKLEQSPSEKNSAVMSYTVSYYLSNGNEIAAIDEAGIHRVGNRMAMLVVSQDGTPPDDVDALQSGMAMPDGMMLGFTSAGGTIFRVGGRTAKETDAHTLLGEFRVDPQTRKGRVIPALEINTEKGMVTIPVKRLVKFIEPVEETKPAKP